MRPISVILLVVLSRCIGFAQSPSSVPSVCDAWIGEFTLTPESVADHRIRKQGDQYVIQSREAGKWQTYDTAKIDLSVQALDANGKPISNACVLKSKNSRLIKIPAGTIYEGKKAETGFLAEGEENNKPALFDVYPLNAPAACDEWLGEFGFRPHRSSSLRIEKQDGDYVIRTKDDQGKWSAELQPAAYFPTQEEIGGESLQSACTFRIDGGLLIKLIPGTPYQATAVTGSNWGEYKAKTGFLLMTMQGFQVDGHDLYRISPEDEVARAPIAPPAIKMGLWKSTGTSTMTNMQTSRKPDQLAFDRRRCITPQSWKPIGMKGDCDVYDEHFENNLYTVNVSCTNPNVTTHVEMKFDSAEKSHFSETMTFLDGDTPYSILRSNGIETFVGSDCGTVKPSVSSQ